MQVSSLRKKLPWMRVRLRPFPLRWTGWGWERFDDDWLAESVSEAGIVRLKNTRTSHFMDLAADGIHHFDSAPERPAAYGAGGFLQLRRQVLVHGYRLWVEPMPPGPYY